MIYIVFCASLILQCLLIAMQLHGCEQPDSCLAQEQQKEAQLKSIITRLCAFARTEGKMPPTKCLHYAGYHPTDNHRYANLLCDAVERRDKNAIIFFCTHYASCVNSYDCYGQAPLFIAAQKEDLEAMRVLLKAGADPNQLSVVYNDHPRNWYVPHLHSRKKVRQSMMQKAHQVTVSLALKAMVEENNIPGIVLLLQAGADPNYLASRPSGGLLEHVTTAAITGMKKKERETARTILSTLLQYGAGTNRTCSSFDYELECGAALIKNTVTEARDNEELKFIEPGILDLYNSLHRLISCSRDYNGQATDAMHQHFLAVKRIFEAHTWNDKDILAALYCLTHRAIETTFISFFGNLLLKAKRMPCGIYKGKSLLNMVVKKAHLDFIECLIAWGACPNEADAQGDYPLDYVQKSTVYGMRSEAIQDNLYKALIACGACIWKKNINQEVDAHIESLLKAHGPQNTSYFFPQWKALCTALCINYARTHNADPNYMCAQKDLQPFPALPIELCSHLCSYLKQKICSCKKEPRHPLPLVATDSLNALLS